MLDKFTGKLLSGALCGALLVLSVSCARHGEERVLVVGSTSVQPFAEKLAHEFHEFRRQRPEIRVRVDVQGGGSTAGIHVVREGACEIGTSSRELTPDEREGLQVKTIARDGLAVIVHRDNPVEDLTHEQVRAIFAGSIRDWSEVGGLAGPIYPVCREDGSGTYGVFSDLVMRGQRPSPRTLVFNSNGAVRAAVSSGLRFIGYISLGFVDERVKAVRIDGVPATHQMIVSGAYPFVRPFYFLTLGEPNEASRQFIEFVLSDQGQRLLEQEGLVRAQLEIPEHFHTISEPTGP